jgi:hypothetical protein
VTLSREIRRIRVSIRLADAEAAVPERARSRRRPSSDGPIEFARRTPACRGLSTRWIGAGGGPRPGFVRPQRRFGSRMRNGDALWSLTRMRVGCSDRVGLALRPFSGHRCCPTSRASTDAPLPAAEHRLQGALAERRLLPIPWTARSSAGDGHAAQGDGEVSQLAIAPWERRSLRLVRDDLLPARSRGR